MADSRVVVPSAARTETGDSGAIALYQTGQSDTLSLLVDITAASGTPSMTLAVEWSHDGTLFAPADPADSHGAAMTAISARVKTYTVKAPQYRIVWTISGGTPSLTFSVSEYTTT